jgi:hypothetical protein
VPATGFVPSRNGLRFRNTFPPGPVLSLHSIGLPQVGIGNARGGLCGGMVFAACDYYDAGRSVPPEATPPLAGSPMFGYIARRQFDSFALPRGVLQYQRYMVRPDGNYRRFGATRPGLSWLTIVQHWPDVRRSLDAGHPIPLGLVAARGLNPLELGRNHVVLAYDYRLTDDNLVIHVYDPNTGPADEIYLGVSVAAPHRSTSITHNIDIGPSIRGFFPVRYRPRDPPATA